MSSHDEWPEESVREYSRRAEAQCAAGNGEAATAYAILCLAAVVKDSAYIVGRVGEVWLSTK